MPGAFPTYKSMGIATITRLGKAAFSLYTETVSDCNESDHAYTSVTRAHAPSRTGVRVAGTQRWPLGQAKGGKGLHVDV